MYVYVCIELAIAIFVWMYGVMIISMYVCVVWLGQVDSIRAYFLPSVRLSHSLSSWTSPDLEQEQQWMRQQMRQADSEFTLNVWQPMLSADLTSPSSADSSGPRSGSSEGQGGPMEDDTESGLAARLGLGSGSRPGTEQYVYMYVSKYIYKFLCMYVFTSI